MHELSRTPTIMLLAGGVLLLLLWVSLLQRNDFARASTDLQVHVVAEHGVAPELSTQINRQVRFLYGHVGHDFSVFPKRLTVDIFSTHASFSRALWALQHRRPQGDTDNSSSVVQNTLLLGPLPPPYLRHNLAHVYTEWIIDGISGNRSDRLPTDPWLYDGVAEYEAYRYARAGLQCAGWSHPPIEVTHIHTAHDWLQLRAGPLGSLGYCLAYLRVRGIVAHVGWTCVVRTLRTSPIWTDSVIRFRQMMRTGRCA